VNGPGRRGTALLAGFAAAQLAQYASFLLSWVVLGHAILAGSVTAATLVGWAAATATSLGCRAVTVRLQAELAAVAGSWLRARLLRGALSLDPAAPTRAGVGGLLGRLLETETLEDQVVGESLPGLGAVLDVGLAAIPLAAGLGPAAPLALAGWLLAAGWAVRRYGRHRQRWTTTRLALGADLIAQLAGHRTRAVQQPPARRHDGEAAALAGYAAAGRPMDRCRAVLTLLVPRGWALTGVVLLSAAAGGGADRASVATGAAGVLFSTAALSRLTAGLAGLADARVAWRQLRSLLASPDRPTPAAGQPDPGQPNPGQPDRGQPDTGQPNRGQPNGARPDQAVPGSGRQADPLVVADRLSYCHPGRAQPALRATDLRIHAGDRVLLTGPAGAGKSTLAAVLAGELRPTAGRLAVRPASRSRPGVLTVPPADRNHLLLAPLAMNLLLGRGWPASPRDLHEAEQVCRALGLGELLDRMPSGLAQLVGETGWQLSAGQRGLVFLARALLQDADVLIVDQTLDAVDPATLDRALRVAGERAAALVLVRSGGRPTGLPFEPSLGA
jgi:ATP-binding cassette subfamily B protein